jgi:hypothetical protein
LKGKKAIKVDSMRLKRTSRIETNHVRRNTMKKMLRPRSFGMIVLALILAATVYGFAAANTVPDTYAGDGTGTISGYEICNLTYSIYGDGDPTDIDQISFDLHADGTSCSSAVNASTVVLSFTGAAPWTNCSPGTPSSSISCTVSQSVSAASTLRVIASE